MTEAVAVTPVAGRADLERFLRLPWRIYENDPLWVPPLLSDVRTALDPAKHPFHQHAEVALFLARRGRDVVGRIAAIVNRAHNQFHDDSLGFFGLFECIEDQAVADALLHTAEEWLRARGSTAVQGPMNLSTNEEVCSPGVLIDGFAQPTVMMTYTPPWYATLIERAGYAGAKDLLTYQLAGREPPPRLKRAHDRLLRSGRTTVRALNMKRFEEEVAAIQEVYNSAWERNWGFVPMTAEEISYTAAQLKPIVNPRLCAIVEVEGEIAGFALNLPDYNIALKHVNGRLFPLGLFKLLWYRRGIDSARTLTLGLKPGFRNRGLDALLMARMFIEGNRIGIWRSECSWILEDNWEMRNALEHVGGVVDKRYRVFEKSLVP